MTAFRRFGPGFVLAFVLSIAGSGSGRLTSGASM